MSVVRYPNTHPYPTGLQPRLSPLFIFELSVQSRSLLFLSRERAGSQRTPSTSSRCTVSMPSDALLRFAAAQVEALTANTFNPGNFYWYTYRNRNGVMIRERVSRKVYYQMSVNNAWYMHIAFHQPVDNNVDFAVGSRIEITQARTWNVVSGTYPQDIDDGLAANAVNDIAFHDRVLAAANTALADTVLHDRVRAAANVAIADAVLHGWHPFRQRRCPAMLARLIQKASLQQRMMQLRRSPKVVRDNGPEDYMVRETSNEFGKELQYLNITWTFAKIMYRRTTVKRVIRAK
ncbi:hypothetical protein B0H10DRAFT_655023 [Mycena sp. CBHHK59/15]|nr:hypothetical protein B0H10DRAFT_655023 [Mycena sp. CBHHK59/15]